MSDSPTIDHAGRTIDFGTTAADYDNHRPGFPESFYARLAEHGWAKPGARALDLGTGTGALALGLARRGLRVVGLDPAAALLEVARGRASRAGLDTQFVEASAESTSMDSASFDLVTAGQCWWWFNEDAVLNEARRVLVRGGRLLIANFCYLPLPGTVAAHTEDLILSHNPGWTKARESGFFPTQVEALDRASFAAVESFSYVEDVPFTHEGWRGRIRTCNGVGAALPAPAVAAFDRELATMLEQEFPEPLVVPHRVFVATGCAGRPDGPGGAAGSK